MREIAEEVQRPVVKALLNLFSFRNRSEAFDLEGTIDVETPTAHSIVIKRQNKDKSVTAVAEIDLQKSDLSSNWRNGNEAHFSSSAIWLIKSFYF